MTKQSVFVVIASAGGPSKLGSLFKVKLGGQGGNMCERRANDEPSRPLLKPLAEFFQEHLNDRVVWTCCSLGSELCLFAHSRHDRMMNALAGYNFNVNTLEWNVIKPPNSPKYYGTVVSAYGKIYSIADPYFSSDVEEPSFERYDLKKQSWEPLKAFPYSQGRSEVAIVGYAVYDRLILYNVSYCTSTAEEFKMWAYDVKQDVWLPVKVDHTDCYTFVGSAAVCVNEIIYAISSNLVIMRLSITRHQTTDEGPTVTCSLMSRVVLSDFLVHKNVDPWGTQLRTLNMVHLGDMNFCLIECGFLLGDCTQCLKLSKFQLVVQAEIKIEIAYSTVYEVPCDYAMHIEHCFALDCEDIEEEETASPIDLLKRGDGNRKKLVECHFKPEYDYVEIGLTKKEKEGNGSSALVQDKVGVACASTLAEPMDLKTALRLVLRNSLAVGGLIRGHLDVDEVIRDNDAKFCVLADDSDKDTFIIIASLCERRKVILLTIPSVKTLGDWSVLPKIDYVGEAREVVCCHCIVVKAFGEETKALYVVLDYLKVH